MSDDVDLVGNLVCSARRCRDEPAHGLLWNNPKLHTPQRRKVWLSGGAHLDYLTQYLQVRAFLRDVVPVEELAQARTA